MEQFAIILLCTLLTVGTIYCLIYAGYELICWIKRKRGRIFCVNYGRDGEWHDYIIAPDRERALKQWEQMRGHTYNLVSIREVWKE